MPLAAPDPAALAQYRGMTWVESRVMQAWIVAHWQEWDTIDFNVRLGDGVTLGEEFDPATRRAAQLLSQKRADAIAQRADQVLLIEVKVRVNPSSLGQLLTYRDLFVQQYGVLRPVRMLAIGRQVVPDFELTLRAAGVEVELYPRVADEVLAL